MDRLTIQKIFRECLIEHDVITLEPVRVLEKEWGYLAQARNKLVYYNAVFDRSGKSIYPFNEFDINSFLSDPGSIYRSQMEIKKGDDGEDIYWHEVPDGIYLKELDANHFIVPSKDMKGEPSNLLFYINENEEPIYKGVIDGWIRRGDKKLVENKIVLTQVPVDKSKDEYEMFFYSWDKNCIVSDKWSTLDNTWNGCEAVLARLRVLDDLKTAILQHIQLHNVYLATLIINSSDNKHHMNLISLVDLSGIPLIDLMYLSPDYSVKSISLEKKRIGEVNEQKKYLQEVMNQKMLELSKNKENIVTNFFRVASLEHTNVDALGNSSYEEEGKQKYKK